MKKLTSVLLLFCSIFLLSSCEDLIDDEGNTEIKEPLVIFTFTNNSQYRTIIGLNVSEPYYRGFLKTEETFDLEAEQQITKTKNYYYKDDKDFNFCLVKYLSNTDMLIYLVSLEPIDIDNIKVNVLIDNTDELNISGSCKILSTQSWTRETWNEQF